jgi:GxxExxY protein
MPVRCDSAFRGASLNEFEKIDYVVMGCAYSIQNELGRLCDESIYQNDLVQRLFATGIRDVQTEVPLTVTYNGFCKMYYLDLVVEGIGLYELKAVGALAGAHEAQLISGYSSGIDFGLGRLPQCWPL